MKVYFLENGRFDRATGASIFKQSDNSDILQLKLPMAVSNSIVHTTFMLPFPQGSNQYGQYSAESLLMEVKPDAVDGGYLWEATLPQGYLANSGTAYLSAKVQTNDLTVIKTTEQVQFLIEASGDYVASAVLPEQAEQILAALTQAQADILDLYATKQDKQDNSLQTTDKTVVGAINELNTQVGINTTNITDNTEDIAQNTSDIAYLYQHISQSEFYVGTISGSALPTDQQLTSYDTGITGRVPANGDTIIFILEIEGETDKNYKYIFSANGWNGYEIPAMEEASNGSLGIIEGTYAIGSANNTLVNIAGGQILDIFVKDTNNAYRNIREYLNTTTGDIQNIINGTTQVGFALRAVQDELGNNIVSTYLTQNAGATKQFVRDYALPRVFNDVNYITASGFSKDIPTTPASGIQFELTTNAVGSFAIFNILETLNSSYELSRENGYNNRFWIASDKNTTVEFRLTTSAKKASEAELTDISIELSNTINLVANTLTAISFDGIFDLLGQNVLKLDVGDTRAQKLEVITQSSEATTFSLYCNSTVPSTFYMKTLTQVIDINTIGEAKEVFVSANSFELDTASGLYKALIPQTEHAQPVGNNYIVQGSYATDATTYRSVALDFSVEDTGDITIWAEEPANYRVLIAAKVETLALGILRLTNPVVLEDIDFAEIGAIEITQTVEPTNLVLPDPALSNVVYKVFVFNNGTSTQTINVNGLDIVANSGRMYLWQGAWVESNSTGITTQNVWDSAKNQWLSATLSTLATEEYVDSEIIANIGNIQVLDFGYTRTGTTLTGSPTTPINITDLIAERIYLIDGDWAVSNDWINTDTVKFVLSDNTEINILTEKNTSGIGKVGDLNQVKFPYDAETGHRTIFFAKLIYKNNQYFFGLVPSASGQDIVTIDCETLVDYSTGEIPFPYNNGQKFYCYNSNAMYFQDHIYNAVYNYTTSTVSFTDLKIGGVSVDNTTITKNAQDIISAIGVTDGTNVTTASEIRGAISVDRAGVKSLSNGKIEFTMAQFEGLATVDANTEYDLTDHPTDSITNAQMTFALTCVRLFPEGATYICQDNGTYSEAHIYKIAINNGVKSWVDMTSTLGYAIRSFL